MSASTSASGNCTLRATWVSASPPSPSTHAARLVRRGSKRAANESAAASDLPWRTTVDGFKPLAEQAVAEAAVVAAVESATGLRPASPGR